MAQYFTDFSGDVVGASPAGWTRRWRTDRGSFVVADAPEATGGKTLRAFESNYNELHGLSWDVLDSDVARENAEVVMRFRIVGLLNHYIVSAFARGSGESHATSYLYGGALADTNDQVRAIKRVNGAGTTIGSYTVSLSLGQWYWVRVRVNGDQAQVRFWQDGSSEPEPWGLTQTDAAVSGSGWVGLAIGAFGTVDAGAGQYAEFDLIGVGTDGAAAPTAPVGGGTSPQGVVTIGTITPSTTSASVAYSYNDTDQTGFEYRLDGGAATGMAASPATVSGLTAGTEYDIEIRAVNASGVGAWSSVATFNTTASGDTTAPTLTGAVTFASITQTSYTASWPAGSDNVAMTGYEYQIGSTAGAWVDAGNNLSAAITGRTAGATETVYVRAYDAAGNRSTPAISGEVTLESAPTLTKKLRIDETLYTDKAKTATFSGTADITVLDRAATRSIAYQANAVTITAGALDITNAAFETLSAAFDIVVVVSGTVRGVFPATVVED